MKPSDQLSVFVRDALAAGQGRATIREALARAGWRETEAEAALEAWDSQSGLPPVPRPRPYVSAREGLLFGLLFLSLGLISWHLCTLGFELIDMILPDGSRYGGGASQGVRWSVAALVTFAPVFLLLDRRVRRMDRAEAGGRAAGRSLVRRWLAAVTLFIASLVLLGDLVMTIYTLLNGELTLRFVLKALLVAVTAVLIFAYYRDEMDA